ncbi:MAG: SMC-Scp complex subunit ScpB, partial [Bacteroidota bacterium]
MSELKYMEINGQPFGAVVEAILFASDKPLAAHDIASVITGTELAPPIGEDEVVQVIQEINAELEEQGRAFTIQVVGEGFSFATQPKYHSWLEHFQHQNAKRKLSPSAVETLAIVAYRQPVTKPEVDHIRGVDSGYILRQLLEKDLIEVAGRYEGPGRALLYRTTPVFLQHFGISSIDELPRPREIEEILKDDDMAEHRQLMLELKSELKPPPTDIGEAPSSESDKTDDTDDAIWLDFDDTDSRDSTKDEEDEEEDRGD